jgi:predicted GNAT family N-acyltransferase
MPERVGPLVEAPAAPTIFRPLRRVDELREAFALRYEIYAREGWIAPEYRSAATGLELDGCDGNSLHFGLFQPRPSDQLVGYVRLIGLKAEPVGTALTRAILETEDDPILRHAWAATYPQGLPVFASLPVEAFRQRLVAEPATCVELSRLIVREEQRGHGFATRLVDGALAAAAARGIQVVLLGCGLPRVPMFQALGFELVPTPVFNYPRIDRPSRVLWRRVDGRRSETGGRS